MLGISLNTNILSQTNMNRTEHNIVNHYQGVNNLLKYLLSKNITSIELRNFTNDVPFNIDNLIKKLWDFGFNVTVHGHLQENTSFIEHYKDFTWVFDNFPKNQNKLLFVFHALNISGNKTIENVNKTVEILNKWSNEINDLYQINFSIELNRFKNNNDPSTVFENLISIVRDVNSNNLGICWDWGHYCYNKIKGIYSDNDYLIDAMPLINHVHAHNLSDALITHHFFDKKSLVPIQEYIELLNEYNYSGIYNLEFGFNRVNPDSAIYNLDYSIDLLSHAIKYSS